MAPKISAAEQILSLVSGFSKERRERRSLMLFQAHIDDSGSEPGSEMFFLAGSVASTAEWMALSDE